MVTNKSLISYLANAYESYRADQQASQPNEPTPRAPRRVQRLLCWFLPNGGTILMALILVFTQSAWARSLNSPMNMPGPSATTTNYQGRLADITGVPLDGSYDLSFAIYGSADGTDLIWPTTGPELHTNVPVSSGLFSVGLGSLTAGGIPTTVWNGDRYLEISVEGETLSPRELIRGVPVAGMALTVPDGAIGSAQIADGAIGALQIANEAIGTAQITDGAVTRSKAPLLISSTVENTEIRYGYVVAQATSTTAVLTVDIDFAPDYPAFPALYLQPAFNNSGHVIATYGAPCDRTMCRVFLVRVDGGNWQSGQTQRVEWLAVGQP